MADRPMQQSWESDYGFEFLREVRGRGANWVRTFDGVWTSGLTMQREAVPWHMWWWLFGTETQQQLKHHLLPLNLHASTLGV